MKSKICFWCWWWTESIKYLLPLRVYLAWYHKLVSDTSLFRLTPWSPLHAPAVLLRACLQVFGSRHQALQQQKGTLMRHIFRHLGLDTDEWKSESVPQNGAEWMLRLCVIKMISEALCNCVHLWVCVLVILREETDSVFPAVIKLSF